MRVRRVEWVCRRLLHTWMCSCAVHGTVTLSFAEYRLFCRALLQKRLMILHEWVCWGLLHTWMCSYAVYGTVTLSFAECRLFCRALLQKRLIILYELVCRGLLHTCMRSCAPAGTLIYTCDKTYSCAWYDWFIYTNTHLLTLPHIHRHYRTFIDTNTHS